MEQDILAPGLPASCDVQVLSARLLSPRDARFIARQRAQREVLFACFIVFCSFLSADGLPTDYASLTVFFVFNTPISYCANYKTHFK